MKEFASFIDNRGLLGEPTKVAVMVDFYAINDTPCILLNTVPTESEPYSGPWGTASICLHDFDLPTGCIHIDERSENAGMAKMMMDAGVVAEVISRDEDILLCKLTDKFNAYVEQCQKEQDDEPYYMK